MFLNLVRFWQNSFYRFIGCFLLLFAVLYYFNIFFIGITAPGGFYSAFLDAHLNYISGLRYVLINTSAWLLEQLGYTTFNTNYWLRVSGFGGIILVYSCLGFGVMSFFTAFVLAWPKSIRSKLIFLPLGLIIIQLLNITRFILLSLYWNRSGFKEVIDHHDLFNIILYLILLGMIYLWINTGKSESVQSGVAKFQ